MGPAGLQGDEPAAEALGRLGRATGLDLGLDQDRERPAVLGGHLGDHADLAPVLVRPVGQVEDREPGPLGEEVGGGVGLGDPEVVAEEHLEQLAEEQVGHRVSPLEASSRNAFALGRDGKRAGNVI